MSEMSERSAGPQSTDTVGSTAERAGGPPRPGAPRPDRLLVRNWRDVLMRVKGQIAEDHLSIVAGGVAFFLLMALFPMLAGMVALYALVADPATLEEHMSALGTVMPQEAQNIIFDQIRSISASSSEDLSFAALGAFLLTLWSASKGAKAMVSGLNVAYGARETRGFFRLNGLALLTALGAIVFAIVALTLVAVFPAVIGKFILRGSDVLAPLLSVARWILLAALVAGALAALYQWGPSRATTRWRWVTVGSVLATILWLAASIGFSVYVSKFGSYNETYGTLGAVVILLMWLFISAYVFVLGAELNGEIERQSHLNAERSESRRMGQREAEPLVADPSGRTH